MAKQPLILAIDNEWNTLKLIKMKLGESGYRVITASNGQSALALFEHYKPDLVLLDINLPDIDGFEVLSLIKERSDVPVIMVTVRDDIANMNRALLDEADDCVTKPFNYKILKARINAKLRRIHKINV